MPLAVAAVAALGTSVLARVDAGHYALTYRDPFFDGAWLTAHLPAGADWDTCPPVDYGTFMVMHIWRRVVDN
jgi:hypothetical protein